MGAVGRALDTGHSYLGRIAFGHHSENHHWARIRLNQAIDEFLDGLDQPQTDVAEISGRLYEGERRWGSYTSLEYPEFDLTAPPAEVPGFDLVICNQVLEHVVDPVTAAKTLFALCRPGGRVVVGTPFMLRVHPAPGDYWRFTEDGMRLLLEHAGFARIATHSWGNAACVRANLRRWAYYWPWRSLRDNPLLPVVVWAFAERPA
jgi:SAM-dependent methyltransferase